MRRTLVVMLVLSAVGTTAYWVIWYTQRDWLASEHTQAYYDFENAFPLADLWFVIGCVLAVEALSRRRPSALFWLLAAGASGLYLGCMDLLYDLEHGIFTKGGGGAVEGLIVAYVWVQSILVLRYGWTHRGELLGGGAPSGE